MKAKNYRAASLSEALEMVKRDLGPEAVILKTRRLNQAGPYAAGDGRRFEVTAALEEVESKPDSGSDRGPTLRMELKDLKRTVDSLVRDVRCFGMHKSAGKFGGLMRAFHARGVEKSVLSEVMADIVKQVEKEEAPADKELRRNILTRILDRISIAGGIKMKDSGGKVVALVGPTGTGKTTTIAKLASKFKIVEGRRVALITCDTFRIGAVEQLRAFADIASIPLAVVFSPKEMSEAIRRFESYDLILIDTPGRSPNDLLRLKELKGLMAAAGPDEIHLAIAAGARYNDLSEILARFSEVAVTHLLFTKLDETSRYGDLVSLAAKSRKAVSYVTVGQNVPDDIALFRKSMAARMLLSGTYNA